MTTWMFHAPTPGPFRPDGVELCGQCLTPRDQHRVRHKFKGALDAETRIDECQDCGLPYHLHDKRSRSKGPRAPKKNADERYFMGVDGEGCGYGPHRYVMLCAADETGKRKFSVENEKGLSTVECLDFLLGLPKGARLFGYSFGYDLTKILADLPNQRLFWLLRPEGRMRNHGPFSVPQPVIYQANGVTYHLNCLSSKFQVRCGKDRLTLWDIFRFFGTSFVRALKDWDVGTPEERETIQVMKDKRGLDDWMSDEKETDAARAYCFSECYFLGSLARKLVTAHKDAGLELKKFFGAGSSADAMLKVIGVQEKIVKEPAEMKIPVMSAFFGGRFENSVVGKVEGILYNIDIASAYPYQITDLPCLLHSTWVRTKSRKRITEVKQALVKYRLGPAPKDMTAWGPLPFRTPEGSIIYPTESGGGWVWRDEYLMAEKLAPNLEFVEAYLLDGDCDCKPFSKVPEWYIQRLAIGKEGAGLVFKLGPNSIYGKLAQSIGLDPPYQSWTWAGITTSGTRAQLGEVIVLHKDRSNVLATATDGIISREWIDLPQPRDTGTAMAKKSPKEIAAGLGKPCKVCGVMSCELAHKPLGSWERKVTGAGVFFARPGVYFDLAINTEEDLDKIRARGVGRKTMAKNLKFLMRAWEKGKDGYTVSGEDHARFLGARSGTWRTSKGEYRRSANYGEWHPMPVEMSFDPNPKRERIIREPGQSWARLTLKKMPLQLESVPYDGTKTTEGKLLADAEILAREQPDFDEPGGVDDEG